MKTKLLLIAILSTLLCGCVFYQTDRFRVWALCYRNDTILPNGMWQTNELGWECNKREQLQVSYKPGEIPSNNRLEVGLEKYKQEH